MQSALSHIEATAQPSNVDQKVLQSKGLLPARKIVLACQDLHENGRLAAYHLLLAEHVSSAGSTRVGAEYPYGLELLRNGAATLLATGRGIAGNEAATMLDVSLAIR